MKKLIAVISIVLFTFAIGCNEVVDSNGDHEDVWADDDEMQLMMDKPDTDGTYHE